MNLSYAQEDTDMKQFGFIGMGNMGYAILKGLLKTGSAHFFCKK